MDARAGCNSVPFSVESITGDGCASGSHSKLCLKLVYLPHKTKAPHKTTHEQYATLVTRRINQIHNMNNMSMLFKIVHNNDIIASLEVASVAYLSG